MGNDYATVHKFGLVVLGIYFTSPSEGWAIGYDLGSSLGVLLHYLNGSWTRFSFPEVPDIDQSFRPLGIHFTSPNEGWVVGGGHKQGVLLHYLNGTWATVTPPSVSDDWTLNKCPFYLCRQWMGCRGG